MQRRYSPSILPYGFGLALALSLVFNGFLLYEQSHQRSFTDFDPGSAVRPVDRVAWQQELSDCQRVSQQKDSLIYRLEQATNTPPGQAVIVQRTPTK